MVLLGDWLKRKLILVSLEIMLILVQNSCSVCADRTIGQKSFWTHEMELLGDVDHVDSRYSLFGDSVSVGERLVRGLRQTYHRLRNPFGHTLW
jgi:hypothetical protein